MKRNKVFITGVAGFLGSHLAEKLSKMGDEHKFNFPLPKVEGGNISYSGTKTAFINFLHKNIDKNKNFIDENLSNVGCSVSIAKEYIFKHQKNNLRLSFTLSVLKINQ